MAFSKFIETARSAVEDAAKVAMVHVRYPANMIDSKVIGDPHATFELPLMATLSDNHRAAYEYQLALMANKLGYLTNPVKVFQPMGSYPGSLIVKITSPIQAGYPIQKQLHAGS